LCRSQIDCSLDRRGQGLINWEKFMRDVEEFAPIYREYKAERENKGNKRSFDNHLEGFNFPLTERIRDMGFERDGYSKNNFRIVLL
jgi:hypothetical protein